MSSDLGVVYWYSGLAGCVLAAEYTVYVSHRAACDMTSYLQR